MNTFSQLIRNNQKSIFGIILIFQLSIMLFMSQDVGISADEGRHIRQAEKVYNYYKTDGEDKSALENTGRDPMQFNGQSFDNLMYVITKKFNVENYIELRHFFIAFMGWLIIFITGLIAKESWGYKGAILAILLLFISPRFIGHALNNNKDIPFALGFILSIYGIIKFFRNLPKIKTWDIIWLVTGIGIAISIRLAGLLSIGFLGLFSAIYYLKQKPYFKPLEKAKLKTFKKLIIAVPLVALIGFLIGILYWPFIMVEPITNIKTVLDATNSHPVSLNQLFSGEIILSSKIPSDYVITYMLISYPLVVLVGTILAGVIAPFKLKKANSFNFFIIAFSFVFVTVWMSIETSNFYGGIRHLLFIYPLAIGISVFGFSLLARALENMKSDWIKLIPTGLIILLSINPIAHLINNYPYSYIYFNELVGGVKNTNDKYETDYFQHSLKHLTEWFISNELPKLNTDSNKIKVISNDGFNTGYYLRKVEDKVEMSYERYYEKSKADWDYAIFYCGYINPSQLTNDLWPPKGTIHVEEVDGFPIGAVVKRVSKEDYKGFEALKNKKTEEAKKHFHNFLQVYPESEEVLAGYARILLMERKLDSTIIYADSAIIYNPRQINAWFLKASAYNSKKEYEQALKAANTSLEIKETFAEGLYQKGYALKNLKKPNEALKAFQKATANKKDYYQAYMQMGNILMNYKNYKKALNIYKKILDFKEDDLYTIVYSAKCYHLMKDNINANKLLNSIQERHANNFEVVKLKCRMAMQQNEWNTAAHYLNMARNINNNAELFLLRAQYFMRHGKVEAAKQNLDKSIELDPAYREALELQKAFTQPAKSARLNKSSESSSQSIMFQEPKKNKRSPITFPSK